MIRDNFPFKVIACEECEADDVCGIIAGRKELGDCNKVIVSSDTDFIQLLKHENVYIYNPVQGAFLVSEDPKRDLLMKICLGDDSDSIPSICNKEIYKEGFIDFCINTMMIAKTEKNVKIKLEENENLFFEASYEFKRTYGLKASRSMKFQKKRAVELINNSQLYDFLQEHENKIMKKKFIRNNKLINLENQPTEIKQRIIDKYDNYGEFPDLKNLYKFFIKNKFRGFLDNTTEIGSILAPLVN